MGHSVFVLGSNGLWRCAESFRPPIAFSEAERNFYVQFAVLGGVFIFGDSSRTFIPAAFVELFDVVIATHDPAFIERFWPVLRRRPVIWRTIGQGIDILEDVLRPYRDKGMLIVRSSPIELEFAGTLGQDWLVRYGKPSHIYCGWTGSAENVLMFANYFGSRYPEDLRDYAAIVRGFPSVLGGKGNEELSWAIGMVDWEDQLDLYRSARVYLYASGMNVPQGQNFIEAWMTGAPIVVHAPLDRRGPFFEVDRLVEHGVSGFIARDVASARARISDLLHDPDMARTISIAGREAARALFGNEVVAQAWATVFRELPAVA